ncbi:MAG: Gfo/Idh/MocA family protein [Pyrinomonadaceae bacterium]
MSNERPVWTRRDALKSLGMMIGGAALGPKAFGSTDTSLPIAYVSEAGVATPAKAVTAITLGAGSRGNVYGGYALKFPEELDIVGVAEPIPIRNERYTAKHQIAEKNRFKTWEDVFKVPKFADAVLITTPDNLHYGPCIEALKMGYDVLLEKPIAPTEKECRDILSLSKKTQRIVGVCHVLRYAPYFVQLKHLIESGAVGELISIQHLEPIEHIHMSHSYVRGNWHNSKETTPIILAKSCHDLDILRWMIGRPSRSISAMGDLKWFRRENAPDGSAERCTDGCKVEAECPYSAIKVYHKGTGWRYVFDLPDDKGKHADAVMEYLKTTNYGRCVYRMNNDQPDHYITSMTFEGGVTANFSMEAFTPWGGRRTRVMGSMGFIEGDMDTMTHTDFQTNKVTKWDSKAIDVENYRNSGHGGGDWRLLGDWIRAVDQQDPGLLTSTIDVSFESHLMGFAAEKSRRTKRAEQIRL